MVSGIDRHPDRTFIKKKFISDSRYRVIKRSSRFRIREVFSHPYISSFFTSKCFIVLLDFVLY